MAYLTPLTWRTAVIKCCLMFVISFDGCFNFTSPSSKVTEDEASSCPRRHFDSLIFSFVLPDVLSQWLYFPSQWIFTASSFPLNAAAVCQRLWFSPHLNPTKRQKRVRLRAFTIIFHHQVLSAAVLWNVVLNRAVSRCSDNNNNMFLSN